MPTIRKATSGEEFLHGYGTVAGGDTIEVDADTAEYLVEQDDYERVNVTDISSAESETPEENSDSEPESVSEQIDSGVCPWCPPDDRYEGDGVPQHASSAHPEAWADYSEDDG
jgi:hypothetical protein